MGDVEVEVEGSESRVGGDEVADEGSVFCSEGEADGDGFVGFFISSAGFGSETCGPMK